MRSRCGRGAARRSHRWQPQARAPAIRPPMSRAKSDIIMTMVTDTKAVEEVVLGEHGIASGARPGSLVVDHSTIAPDGARRIAEALEARGIEMLDAPVSGGSTAAEAGHAGDHDRWIEGRRRSRQSDAVVLREDASCTSARAAPVKWRRRAIRSARSSINSARRKRCCSPNGQASIRVRSRTR